MTILYWVAAAATMVSAIQATSKAARKHSLAHAGLALSMTAFSAALAMEAACPTTLRQAWVSGPVAWAGGLGVIGTWALARTLAVTDCSVQQFADTVMAPVLSGACLAFLLTGLQGFAVISGIAGIAAGLAVKRIASNYRKAFPPQQRTSLPGTRILVFLKNAVVKVSMVIRRCRFVRFSHDLQCRPGAGEVGGSTAGELAKAFMENAVIANGGARPAYIHADNGTSMTSKPVADLLSDLHIAKSHSRPHVSNDNPYSEAQFKTLKYCPVFPGSFTSLGEAAAFCRIFFDYYNNEHRHSGIGLHTPQSVHDGTAGEIRQRRQEILDAAYSAHPERFRSHPVAPKLPGKVWINKPRPTIVTQEATQINQAA